MRGEEGIYCFATEKCLMSWICNELPKNTYGIKKHQLKHHAGKLNIASQVSIFMVAREKKEISLISSQKRQHRAMMSQKHTPIECLQWNKIKLVI